MNIDQHIVGFEKVDIDDIGRDRMFSNRKDLKYLIPIHLLPEILDEMQDDYVLMTVNGITLHDYRTYYYDTPDFQFYRDHHQGKQNRMKVRSRSYTDGHSFIEVKRKTNRSMTLKNRLPILNDPEMNRISYGVLKELSLPEHLELDVQIFVGYKRLTFFSQSYNEKVTIDLQLQYQREKADHELSGLFIAESKGSRQLHSKFNNLMRDHRIKQTSFSKYCYGVYQLVPTVKKNNFKPLQHKLEKLMHAHELSSTDPEL
jgi:hypothetical protein